jgi:hypothetical protein
MVQPLVETERALSVVPCLWWHKLSLHQPPRPMLTRRAETHARNTPASPLPFLWQRNLGRHTPHPTSKGTGQHVWSTTAAGQPTLTYGVVTLSRPTRPARPQPGHLDRPPLLSQRHDSCSSALRSRRHPDADRPAVGKNGSGATLQLQLGDVHVRYVLLALARVGLRHVCPTMCMVAQQGTWWARPCAKPP